MRDKVSFEESIQFELVKAKKLILLIVSLLLPIFISLFRILIYSIIKFFGGLKRPKYIFDYKNNNYFYEHEVLN